MTTARRPESGGENGDYCIEVDFERGAPGDPRRVFDAVSGLIEAFQGLDIGLAKAIDAQVCTELVLTDIEVGSIRTWVRSVVGGVSDEDIMKHGWKAVARAFMVEGKHAVLRILGEEPLTGATLEKMQNELEGLAQKSKARRIPAYGRVERKRLVAFCEGTSNSLARLREREQAKYIGAGEKTEMPKELQVSETLKEELLIQKKTVEGARLVLAVKKPDYLGYSMWDFRHEGHTIEAVIEDHEWLQKFQMGRVPLEPGDALDARVRIEVQEGFEGESPIIHYAVTKVEDVVKCDRQRGMFSDGDEG